jgi:hypothetical protein
MPADTQRQANTAKLAIAVKSGEFPKSKAGPSVKQMANSMSREKLQHFTKVKECMTEAQKRKLLGVLRTLKEEYTGNVGGETDIRNADNLMVAEDEFTARVKPEPNVIARTYDTEADFESYVRMKSGIEMTPKELEAIANFKEIRPVKQDKFSVEFRTTDDFGNNNRTIIKKLLQGKELSWVAFSTFETAEEEGKPDVQKAKEEPPGGGEAGSEKEPELPPLKEADPSTSKPEGDNTLEVKDPIRVTWSITFQGDDGADVLTDFLQKLDI